MPPELINTIATIAGIIVAGLGAFLFAFWISMGIWTFNDIRSRSRDWLAIVLACLLVLVFPIIGLILYMMIRPKETLADIYDRALEEETLLRELEGSTACYQCGTPINDEWVYCPTCHVQLQHSCRNCNQLVRAEWGICVHCGTAQQGVGRAQQAQHEVNPQSAFQPPPVQQPGQQSGQQPASQPGQQLVPLVEELAEGEVPEVALAQRRGRGLNPFMRPGRNE